MTQTGIATPHDLLGGALPGRIHLLTGPPGSGKTSACLQFLREGMRERERAALLTLDRPRDLRTHASHMGIDLRACLRDGRLTLLRYRGQFAQRLAESASPRRMIADLGHMITLSDLQQMFTSSVPTRIVIDPVSPFLGNEPLGWAVSALADWLEQSGISALVTWNGDVTAVADRRLEPLLERAAVILRFRHAGGQRFEATIVRARHAMAAAPPVNSRSARVVASSLRRPRCGVRPHRVPPSRSSVHRSDCHRHVPRERRRQGEPMKHARYSLLFAALSVALTIVALASYRAIGALATARRATIQRCAGRTIRCRHSGRVSRGRGRRLVRDDSRGRRGVASEERESLHARRAAGAG